MRLPYDDWPHDVLYDWGKILDEPIFAASAKSNLSSITWHSYNTNLGGLYNSSFEISGYSESDLYSATTNYSGYWDGDDYIRDVYIALTNLSNNNTSKLNVVTTRQRPILSNPAFSSDGELLLLAFYNESDKKHYVRIWSVKNKKFIADVWGWGLVSTMAFSPDGKYLAFGTNNSAITEPGAFLDGVNAEYAFSNGYTIICSFVDIFDVSQLDKSNISQFQSKWMHRLCTYAPPANINRIRFSSNSRYLAVNGSNANLDPFPRIYGYVTEDNRPYTLPTMAYPTAGYEDLAYIRNFYPLNTGPLLANIPDGWIDTFPLWDYSEEAGEYVTIWDMDAGSGPAVVTDCAGAQVTKFIVDDIISNFTLSSDSKLLAATSRIPQGIQLYLLNIETGKWLIDGLYITDSNANSVIYDIELSTNNKYLYANGGCWRLYSGEQTTEYYIVDCDEAPSGKLCDTYRYKIGSFAAQDGMTYKLDQDDSDTDNWYKVVTDVYNDGFIYDNYARQRGMTDYLKSAIVETTLGISTTSRPTKVYAALMKNVKSGGTLVKRYSYIPKSKNWTQSDTEKLRLLELPDSNRIQVDFAVSGNKIGDENDDSHPCYYWDAINVNDVVFPAPNKNLGKAKYIGLFDDEASGNLLFWVEINEFEYRKGIEFTVRASELCIKLWGAFGLAAKDILQYFLCKSNESGDTNTDQELLNSITVSRLKFISPTSLVFELDNINYNSNTDIQDAYKSSDKDNLQCYIESSYMKIVAAKTDSLNDTLTHTITRTSVIISDYTDYVAHFKLDDDSLNNLVINEVGIDGYLGSILYSDPDSATVSTSGKIGTAFYLDTDQYVYIRDGDSSAFETMLQSPFSVSMWFKGDDRLSPPDHPQVLFHVGDYDLNNTSLNGNANEDNYFEIVYQRVSGIIYAVYKAGGNFSVSCSNTNAVDSGWNHVVVTPDGSDIKLYVNGEEVSYNSTYTSDMSGITMSDFRVEYPSDYNWDKEHIGQSRPAGPVCMGSGVAHYIGIIDDVRMFSKSLSTSEIDDLYAASDNEGELTSPIDLSSADTIEFRARSSRTGANFRIGIVDDGGSVYEYDVDISEADTWESKTWDISSLGTMTLDSVSEIIITITNANSANNIYLDSIVTRKYDYDEDPLYHSVAAADWDAISSLNDVPIVGGYENNKEYKSIINDDVEYIKGVGLYNNDFEAIYEFKIDNSASTYNRPTLNGETLQFEIKSSDELVVAPGEIVLGMGEC